MNTGQISHFDRFNAFVDSGWPGILSPTEVAVWLTYHRHADDDGVAYPGPRRLAEVAGISCLGYIRGIRKKLVEKGLLELVSRGRGKESARYRVVVPKQLPGATSYPAQLVAPRDAKWLRGATIPSCAGAREVVAQRNTEHPIEQHTEHPIEQHKARDGGSGQIVIPRTLDTPRFRDAWQQWEQHRREIKKRLTPTATRQQFAKLERWGEEKAIAAIEESIANGWQGIFEARDSNGRGRRNAEQRGEFPEPTIDLPEI